MKRNVEIEIEYDDLSDECKRKIEHLRNEGWNVTVKWPSQYNYGPIRWNDLTTINTIQDDNIYYKAPQSPTVTIEQSPDPYAVNCATANLASILE